jgi:ABC-type multidrug transport system ATPase subunit/ABC-type multidrug transport system permease subunit
MAPLPENTDFPETGPYVDPISALQHQPRLEPMNNQDSEDDNNIATNNDTTKNAVDGIYLRWSRVTKTVVLKTKNQGLLKGSIAGKQNNDNNSDDPRISFSQQLSKAARSSYSQLMMKQQPKPTKNILNEVSGYAAPGEILAMMGPSGSGKTSLLDCLSGRNPYNAGVISVDGRALDKADMKRFMAKIAYVKQADIFFEHLTVRDQLGYTAMMRLPQAWSYSKKMEEVDHIIGLLRLTKVANSQIKMLSGGEKKRVNIGTELLTDPSVLLLDEPTSGLDSTSAVALVKMLQKLARTEHKTIVTSIHQPSSALFGAFDRLIMLAEGSVVYFGKPRESLKYLRKQNLACPDGYNCADHWMDLLVEDSAMDDDEYEYDDEKDPMEEEYSDENDENDTTPATSTSTTGSDGVAADEDGEGLAKNNHPRRGRTSTAIIARKSRTKRQLLIGAWDGETVAEQLDLCVEKETQHRLSVLETTETKQGSKYNTTWGGQYRTLVHRSLKNSQSAIFTPINLIKSCALGILSGLLWFQMEYTESRIFDRSSYFFFTMTFWVFDAMFQSILIFPSERAVILKERSSGSYQLSAYFMAKTTSEMPARLVLPLIYMIISFWMAAISTDFSMFLATTIISLLSVMAGEAIGLLVGATIYDTEKGLTCMTVISLFLALVGGFFVENVPSFLVWSKFLSPFKYSFDASLQLVFDRPVPCDGSGVLEDVCQGSDDGTLSTEQVLEFLGVQGSVGFNVGILIAIGLVPRYIAYLALKGKKEGDR